MKKILGPLAMAGLLAFGLSACDESRYGDAQLIGLLGEMIAKGDTGLTISKWQSAAAITSGTVDAVKAGFTKTTTDFDGRKQSLIGPARIPAEMSCYKIIETMDHAHVKALMGNATGGTYESASAYCILAAHYKDTVFYWAKETPKEDSIMRDILAREDFQENLTAEQQRQREAAAQQEAARQKAEADRQAAEAAKRQQEAAAEAERQQQAQQNAALTTHQEPDQQPVQAQNDAPDPAAVERSKAAGLATIERWKHPDTDLPALPRFLACSLKPGEQPATNGPNTWLTDNTLFSRGLGTVSGSILPTSTKQRIDFKVADGQPIGPTTAKNLVLHREVVGYHDGIYEISMTIEEDYKIMGTNGPYNCVATR